MHPRYLLALFLVFGSFCLFAQPDCVNDNCCCGNIVQVPFPGGNFEDPPAPAPGGIIVFFAGDTYSSWSINGGSIDLLDASYNGWGAGNPNGASNFIDLNGNTPGTISANLDNLTIGCTYTISLWYAKNAGASSANCTIEVEGGAWLDQTWTATNNGAVEWLERCYSFVALATSTELTLIGSGGGPNRGVLLDDITIWQCCGDTEVPVADAPPSPLQVECGDPIPPPPTLNVSDNCPLPVMTELSEDNTPLPCYYTIHREWLVTDGCGNTATASQIIEIEDTQAPVFDPPPSDYTTYCSDGYLGEFYDWISANGNGSASDLCDSPLYWETNYTFPPDGTCTATPVEFIVTDACGNSREIAAYFIIEDFDPPQIITPAQNLTVNCDPNAEFLYSEWLASNGGAEALDPCGDITWDNNSPGGLPVGLTFVTFTATDGCANAVSTTAFFFQPATVTTVFIDSTTCDPTLAGRDTVQTIQGSCLTITITDLALLNADTTLLFETTCHENQAGVFSQNFSNLDGCDSLVITTVDWVPNDSLLLFDNTCDPALAGVFVQNLTAQNGCDSVVTTTVSLLPGSITQVSDTTCDPALAGIFVQNLTAQNGCDSVVTTTVSLLPGSITQVSATTCEPALAGVFVQNLTAQNGCDSIVTTTVSLLSGSNTQVAAATCDPALEGIFVQNHTAQNGCDSVVITTISLQPVDTTQLIASGVCDPALAGTSVEILSNQFGFDSVLLTTTPLLPSPQLSLTISEFNGFEISCSNSADGTITANPIGNGPFSFAWSNGGSSSTLINLSAGSYTVTISSAEGCTHTAQAGLTAPPPLNTVIEIRQPDCLEGSSGTISANTTGGVMPYEYSLDGTNFQSGNNFSNLMDVDFHLVVKDNNGCTVSESGIIAAPSEVIVSLGDDRTILLGDSLFLQAVVNVPYDSIETIVWSPTSIKGACTDCLTQTLQPFTTNTYHIAVMTKNGCLSNDDLLVRVDRSKGIYVPNIFSPNNDGFNDLVTVFARPTLVRKVQYFQIYSRWGERVYQAIDFIPNQNSTEGWDGLFRGQELNPAVFIWVAEVEFIDGTIEVFKGDVTLFR